MTKATHPQGQLGARHPLEFWGIVQARYARPVTNEAIPAGLRVVAVDVTRGRMTMLTQCLTMSGAQTPRRWFTMRPRPACVVLDAAGYDLAPHW